MTIPAPSTSTDHGRSGRRLRTAAAGVVASVTLLGLAGLPSISSAATTSTPSGTSRVIPADWSQGGWGADGNPWGSLGGSDGTSGGSGGSGDGSGGYGDGSGGYGDGSGGSGGGSGGYGDGSGSDGGSQSSSSSNGPAATAAESKGVVLIDTVLKYAGAEAAGTGMIITSSGQVLTNYHVVEGATKITVTVASTGKTYSATVVGHDQSRDVALLQLKDASGLDTVKIDNDSVSVGDTVTAVGNAGGTGSLTAAEGQVTSLSASVTTQAEGTVAGENLKSMIENNADVVAGDSGGPLYDQQGEVIGIDTAGSSGGPTDSYAVPIKEALSIVDQIRSGQATSTVQIGASAFLGVLLGSADDQSGTDQSGTDQSGTDQSGLGNDYLGGGSDGSTYGGSTDGGSTGATVSGVVSGGPAADAGIVAGDTITTVGDHTIGSATDLSGAMAGYHPGDKLSVGWVDANGSSHSATVTLGASPVS